MTQEEAHNVWNLLNSYHTDLITLYSDMVKFAPQEDRQAIEAEKDAAIDEVVKAKTIVSNSF
jgi:hypothetical protein